MNRFGKYSLWLLLFSLLFMVLVVQAQNKDVDPLELRLRAHIEFLADDLLRSRQPGSDGYNIAAAYVTSQFKQMGLKPAGDGGGYLQQVPLRQALLVPGSAEVSIDSGGKAVSLVFVKQFFMRPGLGQSADLQAHSVFIGYGIEAPELQYDDYAAIDVAGKIAVFFAGQPEDFPS